MWLEMACTAKSPAKGSMARHHACGPVMSSTAMAVKVDGSAAWARRLHMLARTGCCGVAANQQLFTGLYNSRSRTDKSCSKYAKVVSEEDSMKSNGRSTSYVMSAYIPP